MVPFPDPQGQVAAAVTAADLSARSPQAKRPRAKVPMVVPSKEPAASVPQPSLVPAALEPRAEQTVQRLGAKSQKRLVESPSPPPLPAQAVGDPHVHA